METRLFSFSSFEKTVFRVALRKIMNANGLHILEESVKPMFNRLIILLFLTL